MFSGFGWFYQRRSYPATSFNIWQRTSPVWASFFTIFRALNTTAGIIQPIQRLSQLYAQSVIDEPLFRCQQLFSQGSNYSGSYSECRRWGAFCTIFNGFLYFGAIVLNLWYFVSDCGHNQNCKNQLRGDESLSKWSQKRLQMSTRVWLLNT